MGTGKKTSLKEKAVRERIGQIEKAIAKGREYLASGQPEHWEWSRPWFVAKVRDGKRVPPHRDWVKNVFLPRMEKALVRAEKALMRLTSRSWQKDSVKCRAKVRIAEHLGEDL